MVLEYSKTMNTTYGTTLPGQLRLLCYPPIIPNPEVFSYLLLVYHVACFEKMSFVGVAIEFDRVLAQIKSAFNNEVFMCVGGCTLS